MGELDCEVDKSQYLNHLFLFSQCGQIRHDIPRFLGAQFRTPCSDFLQDGLPSGHQHNPRAQPTVAVSQLLSNTRRRPTDDHALASQTGGIKIIPQAPSDQEATTNCCCHREPDQQASHVASWDTSCNLPEKLAPRAPPLFPGSFISLGNEVAFADPTFALEFSQLFLLLEMN